MITKFRNISIKEIQRELIALSTDGKTRDITKIAEQLNLEEIDILIAFNGLKNQGMMFVDTEKL